MSPARSAPAPTALSTAVALACCLILAIAGCASGHAASEAAGRTHDAQHAHREGGRSLGALAKAYVDIAVPANHRLDVEVDKYEDERHHDLAAAESALRAQAATERQFDRNLAKIGFPPAIAATARALIGVNEIRARMADREARARSISDLLSFDSQHKLADAQVEAQVKVIRAQLGLPPPESS